MVAGKDRFMKNKQPDFKRILSLFNLSAESAIEQLLGKLVSRLLSSTATWQRGGKPEDNHDNYDNFESATKLTAVLLPQTLKSSSDCLF